MSSKITKEYVAFMAEPFKTWSDNTPMINLAVSNHQTSSWVTLDLTIEEAQSAIEILQAAIEESKTLKDFILGDEDTPF
jgi:hypothetical protein